MPGRPRVERGAGLACGMALTPGPIGSSDGLRGRSRRGLARRTAGMAPFAVRIVRGDRRATNTDGRALQIGAVPASMKGTSARARGMNNKRIWAMNSLLDRITIDPEVCGGKPCIRGTRIWVSLVLDFLADGMTEAELLAELRFNAILRITTIAGRAPRLGALPRRADHATARSMAGVPQ